MAQIKVNRQSFQTVISDQDKSNSLADLWSFRELLWVFAYRDISARYKQTVVGILWVLLKPTLTTVAFTLVFNRIVKLPDSTLPYSVLALGGILPWYFFATSVNEMTNSIVSNAQIVSKVYFPRLILPLSSIFLGLVDFMVAFVLLVALMLYHGIIPHLQFLAVIPFALLMIATSISAGVFLAGLNVIFRDVRHAVPFFLQFGLYVSPVGFSSSIVPEQWRLIYSLNPMVGVIDGFRWAIEGPGAVLYWPSVLISIGMSLFFSAFGFWYFRRVERVFADMI